MVEKGAARTPVDDQRPGRDGGGEADVPVGLQVASCVIPASGFYEWTGPKNARLPLYISAADGKPMSFAGLWEKYRDPGTGQEALSATIIVGAANEFMRSIHDRMPVIPAPTDVDCWLAEPGADLKRSAPEGHLQAWRVSPDVNSNRYHSADAVVPLPLPEGDRFASGT